VFELADHVSYEPWGQERLATGYTEHVGLLSPIAGIEAAVEFMLPDEMLDHVFRLIRSGDGLVIAAASVVVAVPTLETAVVHLDRRKSIVCPIFRVARPVRQYGGVVK
jgi:hypothetical protein